MFYFLWVLNTPKVIEKLKKYLKAEAIPLLVDEKKHKIIDKIEDLNQSRASLRRSLLSLEEKRENCSEKKYEKLRLKYSIKMEKIKKRIHELEEKMRTFD